MDKRTGRNVALKALLRAHPQALAQFKKEFRALRDVHHVNLVSLRELFEHAGVWIMAMDLVEGDDLLLWIRSTRSENENARAFDENRLRSVFADLAEGLQTLHEHGLLHRDLKPSNVKVTSHGRAILLDFGLISAMDPSGQTTGLTNAGTAEYMAPEQARGQRLGPASDWYAFGTCLYQALTGSVPFEGNSPLAILMQKTEGSPIAPSQRVRGLPADLERLAMRLLEAAPEQRPSGEEVCSVFSRRGQGTRPSRSVAPMSGPDVFEGRERELATLEQAMAKTHDGALSVVLIEGESGIGKSELIREFVGRQREKDPRTLVISGHCYENERVPYKAFDECIDALGKALRALPVEEQAAISTENLALAAEVFPVLRNVKAKGASPTNVKEAEGSTRRNDAFFAVSELLLRVSERYPLIVAIHDLEWTDHESIVLFHALLDHEPRISGLFLCTLRCAQEIDPEALRQIESLRARKEVKSLTLGGLAIDAAHRLTRRLLGSDESTQTSKEIALESMGHPLLIAELTRFATEAGAGGQAHPSLDAALSRRVEVLETHERVLLEIAALSDRPRVEGLLFEALGPGTDPKRALMHLLSEKLLVRRALGKVACASSAIKRVVQKSMSEPRAAQLHRSIASALERAGDADASELAYHWDKAHARPQALDAYQRAGNRAAEQLAFARAAELYARALELFETERGPERLKLQVKHAHALAQSGQSLEAARSYLCAAELSDGDERLRLRVWAAQHQLQSAQIEEGIASASAILSELNLPLPQSAASSLARIAWERAHVLMLGKTVKPRRDGDLLHSDKLALDVMADLITPVTWAEFLPGAALNMHHLRRALLVGEVGHVARALSQEAVFRAASNPDDVPTSEALLKRADALAAQSRSAAVEAHVLLMRATVELFGCGYERAEKTLVCAENMILERCPGQQWLLTSVRMLLTKCWFHLGDHQRSVRESKRHVLDAKARGDRFAQAAFATQGSAFIAHLMEDEPTLALHTVTEAMTAWPPHTFGITHTGEVMARSLIASYQGDANAFRFLEGRRKEHDRAFVHHTRAFRDALHFNRGLSAISACETASEAEKARATKALERELSAIHPKNSGHGARLTLSAQLHVLTGKRDEARKEISLARAFYERHAMRTFAESAGYLEGLLEGGDAGTLRARAACEFFERSGWKDPGRAATLLVPVARTLEASANLRKNSGEELVRGRYRAGRVIAERRSGVVTQAIDIRTGKAVALKSLAQAAPQDLARLKHEFRALSGVYHKNLARLDALFEHQGTWTIAMELVEGVDFLAYSRPENRLDTARLRTALHGLLSGVSALHEAGFVHRDVRPTNVLVTSTGRVVLVDFGLVTPLSSERAEDAESAPFDAAYVAPEQIDRQEFQAAADIYAIGTCLYLALTGSLPFEHFTTERVLDAKRRGRPVPPWALGLEVPKDLEELCLSMLEREPEKRPSIKAALSALESGYAPPTRGRSKPLSQGAKDDRTQIFAGRAQELLFIDSFLTQVASGSCSMLLLEGESGIGKSALLQEALRRLEKRSEGWLVLPSRCHENEETPYMAFDAGIEELARKLRKWPQNELALHLPGRAALLPQLFPVLSSVAAIRDANRKGLPIDPARRRREALDALMHLLFALSRTSPLVLAIDDLQWAELESVTLLRAVLEQAEGARIAIIATRRRGEARHDAVERALDALQEDAGASSLTVRPLAREEAEELLTRKIGEGFDPAQLAKLAEEGAGHPLFLHELATSMSNGSIIMLGRAPNLEDALRARYEQVSQEARKLLELVAVAGRPCVNTVFERALGDASAFEDASRELLQQNLITRRGEHALSCLHDRIRLLVLATLSKQRNAELCSLLAQELERESHADAGERARLWDRAGVPQKAVAAYAEAGSVALEVLAFAQAERCFARALELLPDKTSSLARTLLTQRAHAFSRLGLALQAAELYSEASTLASGEERIELRVLTTQHQIQSAQIEQGMANARALLSELHIPLPEGNAASVMRILWERAQISSRQILTVNIRKQVARQERVALDAIQRLTMPVTWVDLLSGAALNAGHLRRALALQDAGHIARALSQEGAVRAMQAPNKPERFEPLFARSHELARGTSDPAIEAHVMLMEASAGRPLSRYVAAVALLERAQELIISRCPGEQAMLTQVRMQLGAGLFNLGDHARCAREAPLWVLEAKERKDVFAAAALSGYGFAVLAPLMRDDPGEALSSLDGAMRAWPPQSFGFAHHGELMARAVIFAYQGGEAGFSWFEAQRTRHDRAAPHRVETFRDSLLFHRFLATLSACDSRQTSGHQKLLKALKSDANRLSTPCAIWAKVLPAFTRGQVAVLEGDLDTARKLLKAAEQGFADHAMKGALHSTVYLLGRLEGGDEGKRRCETAIAYFREQGWKYPLRAATLLVPVARIL